MKISYVIASRNDAFCGDPMARLLAVLRRIVEIASDYEVIVSDWGSEVPIYEVLRKRLPRAGTIRFLHVPVSVTRRFATPFSEVHALNAAVRRSRGVFVGRLDQDILIGQQFARWLADELSTADPRAYFSVRRELPPGVMRVQPTAPIWWNWPADYPVFFLGAVGILLAPRALWHRTQGYDETKCFRNHIEHDLCVRFWSLASLENLGALLNCDFYHIWHERVVGAPENPLRPLEELVRAMQGKDRVNDEAWGLWDFEELITESVL
jgi:hypothetical protein